MLSLQQIEDRLADAENLVRTGADVGDTTAFLSGLWDAVYARAPMGARSDIVRRLTRLARTFDVHYSYGATENDGMGAKSA